MTRLEPSKVGLENWRHRRSPEGGWRLVVEVREVADVDLVGVVERLVGPVALLLADEGVGDVEARDVLGDEGLEAAYCHALLRRMKAVDPKEENVVVTYVE